MLGIDTSAVRFRPQQRIDLDRENRPVSTSLEAETTTNVATPPPSSATRNAELRNGGDYLRQQLEQRLRSQEVAVVPLPEQRRPEVGPPIFSAVTPPNTEDTTYFSENEVAMNSMVLNSETINGDVLEPSYLAQAALQANPDIRFVVPTQARFDDKNDPRFLQEQNRIALRLGVPVDNVVPVRSDMAVWPQDEFLAGKLGLVKPQSRMLTSDTYDYGEAPQGEHWNNNQRTTTGAADLASELGLDLAMSPGIARGGDTHVVRRPDGSQAAYFSAETVRFAANTRGLDASTDKGYLQSIALVMRELERDGVPLDQIAPIGTGNTTYGEVLDTLTDQERRELGPRIAQRFEEMRSLPLPTSAYAYHTDVMSLTPDGKTMFVNEHQADADPELRRQLEFFGYDVKTLPSFDTNGRPNSPQIRDLTSIRSARLSYMNAIMGRAPNGDRVLLMPTEALDPSQLTANDQRAMRTLQDAVPGLRVIPIGGGSALTGYGTFVDGRELSRDWGAHCMSNVLPYLIRER